MHDPAEMLNETAGLRACRPAFGEIEWVRGLRILSATHFRATAHLRPVTTVVPGWLMEILVEGRLRVCLNDEAWRTLEPGQGFLCAPRAAHFERSPETRRQTPYRSVYAIFAEDSGLLRDFMGPGRRGWWVWDSERRLESALAEIADNPGPDPAETLAAAGALLRALSMLHSAARHEDEVELRSYRAEIPALVRETDRFLREHMGRRVRVEDIAAHVGLSPSGLAHAYRRLTGRTAMQTLRELRVAAARNHLLRGRLTLEAIAEEAGFADAAHLSRTFKRVFGRSPRAYLRSVMRQTD